MITTQNIRMAIANRLWINVDKSNYLLFSTGKKQNKLRLNMNKEVLQETASTKYLAVIMDNKLTWKDQY